MNFNKIKNIPNHVVIIPDGNRRWAKKQGLKPWEGHQAGMDHLKKALEKSIELKIPYLTFWGGSWDNLTKRATKEINFLFKIYSNQFKEIVNNEKIHKNKVKINVFGRWKEILPKNTKLIIEKAIEATKNYNYHFLTFLIAYNGTDEMIECIKKITKLAQKKQINKVKITKELIKENLWTKNLPPVDLIIRTGCQSDPHNSAGFMMWDTAYSQFHFTKTLFPDFNLKEFKKIIENYSKRERRLGA